MKVAPELINQLKKENPNMNRTKRRKWLKKYGKKVELYRVNRLLEIAKAKEEGE
jgi:hypothetical protein